MRAFLGVAMMSHVITENCHVHVDAVAKILGNTQCIECECHSLNVAKSGMV